MRASDSVRSSDAMCISGCTTARYRLKILVATVCHNHGNGCPCVLLINIFFALHFKPTHLKRSSTNEHEQCTRVCNM